MSCWESAVARGQSVQVLPDASTASLHFTQTHFQFLHCFFFRGGNVGWMNMQTLSQKKSHYIFLVFLERERHTNSWKRHWNLNQTIGPQKSKHGNLTLSIHCTYTRTVHTSQQRWHNLSLFFGAHMLQYTCTIIPKVNKFLPLCSAVWQSKLHVLRNGVELRSLSPLLPSLKIQRCP